MKVFVLTCANPNSDEILYWYGKALGGNWVHAKWYETEETAQSDRKFAAEYMEIPLENVFVVERKATDEDKYHADSFHNEDWSEWNERRRLT